MHTITSANLVADLDAIPTTAGVYILKCSDPELARDLGLAGSGDPEPVYVGRAQNLRQRIRCHLRGPSAASTFRGSLGLILNPKLSLEPQVADLGSALWFQRETRLSDWIAKHTEVAFTESTTRVQDEIALIHSLQPPLNIEYRSGRPSAVRLARAKAALREAHRRTGLPRTC